jgi:ABC-2 type transport system ATP-binding protein
MEKSAALTIDNVSYAYRGNWSLKRKAALHDLSLEINQGESFGFLGHNGAGKTTAIKCILDLVRPTAGKVTIFGRHSHDPESRTSVGYLPEQPYFYDNLTVAELMSLYATLAGVPHSSRAKAIDRALSRVGIGARLKSPMRSLSKGLMQRVAMAQAIVAEPKLLVLDEPFSGLDPIGRREFRDLLIELHRSGTTIFMSSHILSDVEFLCDRVSILVNGRLRGIYKVSEIPSSKAVTFELIVSGAKIANDSLIKLAMQTQQKEGSVCYIFNERSKAENALRMALEQGACIESFEAHRPSLEDLFVNLVQSGDSR